MMTSHLTSILLWLQHLICMSLPLLLTCKQRRLILGVHHSFPDHELSPAVQGNHNVTSRLRHVLSSTEVSMLTEASRVPSNPTEAVATRQSPARTPKKNDKNVHP